MNKVVVEALSVYCDPSAEITESSELVGDLGMTSFDLIQAMGEVEERTGVSIDMEALAGVVTVGQLDEAVEDQLRDN